MKKYLYFALAVLYACSPALAQDDYPTETDLYVFWQPDRPLTPADFQKSDSLSDRQKRISDAHALYCVGCFGLWTQADAPKGKWTRKRTEVVYIAPAFEKKSSFILHGDTAGIVHEQLLFDLQEVGARLLRYKLEEIKKEADRAAGIQAIVLNTCKAKVREFVDAMSSLSSRKSSRKKRQPRSLASFGRRLSGKVRGLCDSAGRLRSVRPEQAPAQRLLVDRSIGSRFQETGFLGHLYDQARTFPRYGHARL